MPILIPCPTCSGTQTVTHEDRHTETRQDVCPTCAPYADVHPGRVPAMTGETRAASFDTAASLGERATSPEVTEALRRFYRYGEGKFPDMLPPNLPTWGSAQLRMEAAIRPFVDEIASMRAAERRVGVMIEFHQQDFVPGFAAFLPGATTPTPDSRAFCIVNLGSLLAMIHTRDMAREELPYFLAESMMHEIIHVLEQWAGVEFNEERVEALLEKYRAAYGGSDNPSS